MVLKTWWKMLGKLQRFETRTVSPNFSPPLHFYTAKNGAGIGVRELGCGAGEYDKMRSLAFRTCKFAM